MNANAELGNPMTRKVASSMYAIRSLLFRRDVGFNYQQYRDVFTQNALIPVREPLVREDDVFIDFLTLLNEENFEKNREVLSRPYWNSALEYDPIEVFYTCIQFLDDHNGLVPITTIPPASDMGNYIKRVISNEEAVGLKDQMRIALDISNGNPVGAANLAFIASRFMARVADTRAYPDIPIIPQDLKVWNSKLQAFRCYDNSGKCEAAGDTYYFWTHFFTACIYQCLQNPESLLFDYLFDNGLPIMRFVRNKLVKQSLITEHFEASLLGRATGVGFIKSVLDQSDYSLFNSIGGKSVIF